MLCRFYLFREIWSYIIPRMGRSGVSHLLLDNTWGHTRYCKWFRELKMEKQKISEKFLKNNK